MELPNYDQQSRELHQWVLQIVRRVVVNSTHPYLAVTPSLFSTFDEPLNKLITVVERMHSSGHPRMAKKQDFLHYFADFELELRDMITELSQFLGSSQVLVTLRYASGANMLSGPKQDEVLRLLANIDKQLPPLHVRNSVCLAALSLFSSDLARTRRALRLAQTSSNDDRLLLALGRLLEGLDDAAYASSLDRVAEMRESDDPQVSAAVNQWTQLTARLALHSSAAQLARRVVVQALRWLGGAALQRCLHEHPDYRRRQVWRLVRLGQQHGAQAALADLARKASAEPLRGLWQSVAQLLGEEDAGRLAASLGSPAPSLKPLQWATVEDDGLDAERCFLFAKLHFKAVFNIYAEKATPKRQRLDSSTHSVAPGSGIVSGILQIGGIGSSIGVGHVSGSGKIGGSLNDSHANPSNQDAAVDDPVTAELKEFGAAQSQGSAAAGTEAGAVSGSEGDAETAASGIGEAAGEKER